MVIPYNTLSQHVNKLYSLAIASTDLFTCLGSSA